MCEREGGGRCQKAARAAFRATRGRRCTATVVSCPVHAAELRLLTCTVPALRAWPIVAATVALASFHRIAQLFFSVLFFGRLNSTPYHPVEFNLGEFDEPELKKKPGLASPGFFPSAGFVKLAIAMRLASYPSEASKASGETRSECV